MQFESDGEWINVTPQQYVWNNGNVSQRSSPIYFTMKLFHESDFLTIDTINLENKDWLFVCTAFKRQEQSKIW